MKVIFTLFALSFFSLVFSQNKFYVSNSGNNANTGLSASSPFLTIQYAINTALNGDSIIVSPGTYSENINFSGKNVKVCSNFVYTGDSTVISNTKIDGGANGFPVVKFVTGEGPGAQLNGFTVQNGLVALSLTGAGIQVHGWGASPTLKNLVIRNNTLVNQGEGAGMTVFNTEALTILQNVKFLNNSSGQGVGGLKVHAGNISMTNVEFRNNTGNVSAFARSIGAGSTDNYFYPLRNILIVNNIGGICVTGSGLVFMNSTIANNSGGIVLAGNSALLNCIVGSGHTITNQGILAIENSLIKDGQSSVINPIAAMLTYQDNLNGSILFNSINYKLQSYSPAIGFGQDQFQYFSQTYKTSLFDIEYNPRDTIGVTAVDLGCYENVLNQPIHNNKIYVSTNGTNNETVGLITSPFSSIQSAVDYSVDNDSIIMLAGTYTENVICGKTVHFRGQSGAANTIWQHNDMQSYLLTVFHPTWDNNNLKSPSVTGIKFFRNPNIVYNGNTHGLRAQQAAKLTVNKCWFEDIRIGTSTYYGFFNINNCIFYNIEILAFNDAGYSEIDRLPKYNFCTIVNSQVLTAGSPAIYPTFTNCMITKSSPLTSSYFQGTQPMLTKVYIDQSVSALSGSIYSIIPNIQHLGFVNAAIKDFHLKNSSPAIGYGAVVSGLNQDFDNVARPQFSFPDIGAFEHINNSPSNGAPFMINPSNLTFLEDQPITINLTGIDDGDFFQIQTISLTATSNNTSIIPIPNVAYTPSQTIGNINFLPQLNSNGTAPILLKIKDNGGVTNSGVDSTIYTLNVIVLSVNDAPVVNNDSITTNEDTPVSISILSNDTDVDNSIVPTTIDLNLSSSGIQSSISNTQGVWNVNSLGVLTFSPALDFNGMATITYEVQDDSLAYSNIATVTVTVNPIDDIQVSATILDTYCNGVAANGSINISVSQTNGSVGYTWSGPNSFTANTPDISGLESGNYTLTVIDSLSTAVFNFTVSLIPIYEDLSICYVTGDTMPGNHNRIYFNNPGMYNVQYYQILRESLSQGVYDFIGQVTPQDTSFLDLVSNNQAQSFSYKVRAIDSCGNFSSESNSHTTMLLQANLSASNSVNLTWTAYSGTGYTSYYLYRSVNGGIFDLLVTLPASQLSFNDITANVTTNQYLYFVSIVVPNCDFTKSNNTVRSNIKYLTDGGLGINKLEENQLVVSPNPSNGIFNISKTDGYINQNKVYEILNPFGQILLELDFNETINFKTIDLSSYSDGVYFIKEKYGTWIDRLVLSK